MTDESTRPRAPEDGAGDTAATPVMALARPSPSAADNSGDDGTSHWRAELPDDVRRVAEKFSSTAEVLRSYANLERRLGRSVTIPGPDADADEITAFYSRLGRPKTPDAYDVQVPGDLPDHLRPVAEADADRSEFLAAMHAAGATRAVVQAAVDWYCGALRRSDAELGRARDVGRAKSEKSLRAAWGADYDRNLELARRTALHYGGEELITRLEQSGLADDPVCLRALCAIGGAMTEDSLLAGDAAPGGTAQQGIDRIMQHHFGQESYASAEIQGELRDLYRMMYENGSAGIGST